MNTQDIIKSIKTKIRTRENGPASEAMENLGIKYKKNYGLSVQQIKTIGLEYKDNHELAIALYNEDIRELRIMSYFVANPKTISQKQIDKWVSNINNSEQAEQIAINLLVYNEEAYIKIFNWAKNENEFIRRVAFVLIARIAIYKKRKFDIDTYINYIKLCRSGANDESIHVAKAISWALRRIGRLESKLYKLVYETAEEIGFLKTNYTQLISEEILYELNDGMIKSMIP